MRARFLRACCALAVVSACALSASVAAANIRLDSSVTPVFEDVTLDLNSDQKDYSGTVRIELRVRQTTSEFQFHAEEMVLDRVELTGKKGPVDLTIEDGDEGLRMVTCASELAKGDYVLEIDFHKEYNTKAVGLYRMEYEGQGYLFTQFESVDARKAFPCWDEPIFKHEWQLSITIPMQHAVLTNTPVEKQVMGADTKTFRFMRTEPMPSYLLCIAEGPLESVAIPGLSVPGRIYTVKGQKHLTKLAAQYTPPVLAALEKYFGRKYPYKKLDLIAIPEYWPGAMENPGAVTYADNILLLDTDDASMAEKRMLARVHAHEFAHMWFGDLVTMAWWDDLWLNESFADWMGDKITEELYPELGLATAELQDVQRLMKGDGRPSTVPVRKPVKTTSDIMDGLGLAYGKGKTILRMVEMWIGEDQFQQGVRNYINKYEWGNTVADDLFTTLSQAADQDLTPILSSFLEQPGYPLVSVDLSAGGVLTLSQKRFSPYGVESEGKLWSVPVRLKYSDGEQIHTRSLMLDGESKSVEVATNVEWAMPNESAYGYYRWSAPPDMIFKIAADPENTMNERERAVFLANVGALLDAGELGGDDYLAVLGQLARHPSPEVVQAVMSGLGDVSGAFVSDDAREPFAAYVRETLAPALQRYGMEARPDEPETVSIMRPRLMRWLGDAGRHAAVREHCRELAARCISDPSSVDGSMASTALRVAAIEGTEAEFRTYFKKFEQSKEPTDRVRYLTSLGYFPQDELQDELLAYVAAGKLRPNEVFRAISGINRTDKGNDKIFKWLMANYDAITSRIPPPFHSYMPYFVGGCSEERLAVARAFFSEEGHYVDGTQKNLNKVSDRVMDCANLREREGAKVMDYLEKLSLAN